ncbi:unnamed protein product [Nippostrongylus brasiliensis]|uniref:Girdin n=1 Tax=Nippostrongylus brasiliensis TaxID=27835 RepID=A0A158R2P8_NIPBR|nr:unnamed protein product [Nippostrongylus brasiliensis]
MINAKAGRLDEFPSNMRTVPRKSPYPWERPESDAESLWEKELKMSSSTSDFKSVSETLQVSNMQDDSLCTDEFEIINCDTMRLSDRAPKGAQLCLIASRFASISSLEEEIAILKNRIAVIEQENADLKRMNANDGQVNAPVKKLNECEVTEHKELEQKLKDLQQQLLTIKAASREKDLAEVTDQLETALRKIADLTQSHNSVTVKCGTLSDKLSETYAMLLSEKERVAVLEDEIRSLRAAGGEGFNLPLINEQMVVREMQEKEAYAEKLKLELEETRKLLNEQMECCDKKENELRTHVEIINVLKEEDTEGRREIAEKNRKIAELEEMVRFMRLNRAEVNNC